LVHLSGAKPELSHADSLSVDGVVRQVVATRRKRTGNFIWRGGSPSGHGNEIVIGQFLGDGERQRLSAIMDTKRFALKRMYCQLPTPKVEEVRGQYEASLLDQGDRLGGLLTRLAFCTRGTWLGKAFRPLSTEHGEGCNAFGSVEFPRIALPMDTYIDRSIIAPGVSYILDYRMKNRGPIRWLRGELRTISSEILLGFGTFGPREKGWHRLRRVIPFVLVRRSEEYVPTLLSSED
jgi:hypothetical protein